MFEIICECYIFSYDGINVMVVSKDNIAFYNLSDKGGPPAPKICGLQAP